jgi:hypothetical protein
MNTKTVEGRHAVAGQVEREVRRPANAGTERAEVGVFYRVPCIRVRQEFFGEKWVPVIGPKHRDVELGVDWEHWHIDWRFASKRMFVGCSRGSLGVPHGSVISNDSPDPFTPALTGTPELKRRKCQRLMPDFPARPRPAWAAMEAAQRARCDRLKDGHTCPHRGIDLRPFEQADGTAICPSHGLRWDMRTGLLLARHEPLNL